LGSTIVRSLEDTKAKASRTRSPTLPSTHHRRRSLYDISNHSLRGVLHLPVQ
jgi:hypothetical protein